MTRKIPLLAFGFGTALANAQAFIHDSHSHGSALADVERQVSEGIFVGKNVQDRALSGWEGAWQSVNSYLLNSDLDPVLKQKAEKPDGKSVEEYRAYCKKGYATDVGQVGIGSDTIKFYVGEIINSCKYRYSGYKIPHYVSGKKGVHYLLECQQGNANAPKFVQFSDHIIGLRESQHFHIFMDNESQETLLKEMNNWPTYYLYVLYREQTVDKMLHHQNR